MANTIDQDVCKSVRSLGFSATRVRRIVDGVVHDISHNGLEWVADRLKGLQAYYVGADEFPGWIRKGTRRDGLLKPKGWLGALVGTRTKPETIITALSTVRAVLCFDDPTPKQLQKWINAVAYPPTPGVFQTPPLRGLGRLEERLSNKIDRLEMFGPDDIHGTRYPKGIDHGTVRRDSGSLDCTGLYTAWRDSIIFAPSSAWVFQDHSGIRIPKMSTSQSRPILNSLRKGAPDSKKRKAPGKKSGRTLPQVEGYPIGHISFLQQPFGKLRTVANPNRFVQWQLTPLGEVLSDWINHQPGVYTLDQGSGIRWIQDQLRLGHHLTSADLSSASDTLDYKQIIKPLKKSGRNMNMHLEYFEQCSSAQWYVTSDVAREFVSSSTVSWKQGQPLGLRPSFPVLTITNWMAARQAVIATDGIEDYKHPPFAIVGDDIVIHTRYAKEYQRQISLLGGVANVDKAMSSSTQAEFCSRLIKQDSVLRLKSRWLFDNDPQNILTYQDYGHDIKIPHWVRRKAQRIGAFHMSEPGLIPGYHPDKPRSLREKVLAHAVLSLDLRGKTVDKQELHLMSMWYATLQKDSTANIPVGRPRSRRKLASQKSLREASRSDRFRKFQEWNPNTDLRHLPIQLGLVKGYHRSTWEHWMNQALVELENDPRLRSRFPGIRWIENPILPFIDGIQEGSARKQIVETVKTEFDHKSNTRKQVETPASTLKRLDRKLSQIDKDLVVSDDIAMIRRISDDVDELVEVEDGDVYTSFYSKTKVSRRAKVPKQVYLDRPISDEPDFEI